MDFLKKRFSTCKFVRSGFVNGMFVEDENAVGLEVKVSRDGCAGEEIVHRFVKLNAVGGGLMIEKEVNVCIVPVTHADLNLIGHFEQGMNIAHLAKPGDQVRIEMLVALGADVNGFAQAECVHGHGRTACVKVFGVCGKDLAVLGFDDIAP
jgi:hypothetical protein